MSSVSCRVYWKRIYKTCESVLELCCERDNGHSRYRTFVPSSLLGCESEWNCYCSHSNPLVSSFFNAPQNRFKKLKKYGFTHCIDHVSRMPCVTLTLHVLMMLVYDVDSPDPCRNKWFMVLEAIVWNILTLGFLQPLAALVVAVFVCPCVAFSILSGTVPFCHQCHMFVASFFSYSFLLFCS